MSAELVVATEQSALYKPLPYTWRDPHTVPREELVACIDQIERACLENPQSADLFTCLGMARAMNFEPYLSLDALENARTINPQHFWAQMKYAELHYRLRALDVAEAETSRALNLATNGIEIGVARKQLQEIRRLKRDGTQKPAWTKPLMRPALALLALTALLSIVVRFS